MTNEITSTPENSEFLGDIAEIKSFVVALVLHSMEGVYKM